MITPPVTESTPALVIENLDEAKKVEEHAAEIEVAPVVAGSRVEVGTALIRSEDKHLKSSAILF